MRQIRHLPIRLPGVAAFLFWHDGEAVLFYRVRPSSDETTLLGHFCGPHPPLATTPGTFSHRIDPFYGSEPISRLCAKFVTHLFACPESQPSSWLDGEAALFYRVRPPSDKTTLHPSVNFVTLVLLQRLQARFPTAWTPSMATSPYRAYAPNSSLTYSPAWSCSRPLLA